MLHKDLIFLCKNNHTSDKYYLNIWLNIGRDKKKELLDHQLLFRISPGQLVEEDGTVLSEEREIKEYATKGKYAADCLSYPRRQAIQIIKKYFPKTEIYEEINDPTILRKIY